MNIILLVVIPLVWVVCGLVASNIADKRGYNKQNFLIGGFCIGPFAIFAALRAHQYQVETDDMVSLDSAPPLSALNLPDIPNQWQAEAPIAAQENLIPQMYSDPSMMPPPVLPPPPPPTTPIQEAQPLDGFGQPAIQDVQYAIGGNYDPAQQPNEHVVEANKYDQLQQEAYGEAAIPGMTPLPPPEMPASNVSADGVATGFGQNQIQDVQYDIGFTPRKSPGTELVPKDIKQVQANTSVEKGLAKALKGLSFGKKTASALPAAHDGTVTVLALGVCGSCQTNSYEDRYGLCANCAAPFAAISPVQL